MIYTQTLVKIADNSGGFFAICIGILSQSRLAVIGDTVIVAIKSILLNRKLTHARKRKILKGSIHKAVLIRCRKTQRR